MKTGVKRGLLPVKRRPGVKRGLLRLEQLEELQQEADRSSLYGSMPLDWAQPRNHLTDPGDYAAWNTEVLLTPALSIDYGAETGTWGRPWPKPLKVEHNIGRVEHLIEAVLGETVPLARNEREAFGPGGRLLCYAYFTTPALRVLGGHNIAKHLGISADQLKDRMTADPAFRQAIHKVSWLFVSNVESLRQLDVARQKSTRKARRANAKKRKPRALRRL